ncbi:MAG: hypothetical protein HND52_10200 [Ignavibacteriae bacterium]|nr:hypothetical protein [Ignavibacteriota bacterium]NOG98319.1 hypothetical protein [Ignavibacteriota bacterium]
MKLTTNILMIICLLLISFSCASIKPTIYEPQKIKEIKSWEIDFKYEPGEIERKSDNEGSHEVKITTGGRTSSDLQLRDDISYFLNDNFGININKSGETAQGKILINSVRVYWGFKSVDVSIEDLNGLSLARIRVQNGDRNATIKDDYDFAEYVAQAISDVLK